MKWQGTLGTRPNKIGTELEATHKHAADCIGVHRRKLEATHKRLANCDDIGEQRLMAHDDNVKSSARWRAMIS